MPVAGIIILVIMIGGYFAGQANKAGLPSNNMAKTESNGLAYCQQLIEARENGRRPQYAVDGTYFQDDTYKVTLRAQIDSTVKRWQCRLIWTGSSWNVDTLTSSRGITH